MEFNKFQQRVRKNVEWLAGERGVEVAFESQGAIDYWKRGSLTISLFQNNGSAQVIAARGSSQLFGSGHELCLPLVELTAESADRCANNIVSKLDDPYLYN